MRRIGAGLEYVSAGNSFYTAETHIRHLAEAKVGQRLTGSVQVLAHDPKRLHLWLSITRDDDGVEVATLEQMLLHVDMKTGRTAPAAEPVQQAVARIAEAQAALPRPAGAGRHVGAPR